MLARPVLVALVAFALVAPAAVANAAPVARARASTVDAVLFEPVVFTDDSTDADGVIVRSVWTFTDGRDVVGHEVTRALDYAGVHTITLTVTDDAGATASTEIQVLVRAPLMHGRAVAIAVGAHTLADTGDIATENETRTSAPVGEARDGQLRVAALDAEFRVVATRAIARASVPALSVPTPLGYVYLADIESQAFAECGALTKLSASFGLVRFNDSPLVAPGEAAPNTRIALPGGVVLVLNAQDSGASPDRLSVTAVRVLAPGAPPIDVAHAEAGVSHCPYTVS